MVSGLTRLGATGKAAGALSLVLCANTLGGCTSTDVSALPRGQSAYATIPASNPNAVSPEYVIGPFDTLDLSVFQEPDLSLKNVSVDAGGRLTFPLIGSVDAAGKTAVQLARDIETRLGERYLVNPQVTVAVNASVSQQVTVEGAVNDPGVYGIRGQVTLLDALAMANGPTRNAALDRAIVFRKINGQRAAAVFDVGDIRRGSMPDPAIIGGDTVVITSSRAKTAFSDVLAAVPIIGLFTLLR